MVIMRGCRLFYRLATPLLFKRPSLRAFFPGTVPRIAGYQGKCAKQSPVSTRGLLPRFAGRNDMMNTTVVEVRYLLWGEAHISSYVHKQVFDISTTSLQARVIRAVLRYAVCVRINQGDTQCLSL